MGGTVPTAEEALARLDHLTTLGPTPEAFTFREQHPAPEDADQEPPASRTA